jgi:cytochrome c oxidase subunit 2
MNDSSVAQALSSTTLFHPSAAPADAILDYGFFVMAIVAAIGLLVGGLIFYTVVRFRQRPGDDLREPPQIYGSNQLELAWTLVPVLIVVILGLVTARNIWDLQAPAQRDGALRIGVTGHQWWWEFDYPAQGFVTANELHVPVGTRVALDLASADVIHSFWIPELAGKMDLVPGRNNEMWFEALRPGLFVGQCAEYCGTQHAHMLLRVVVETPEAFAAWVAHQQRDADMLASHVEGRQLFESTACVNCHTIRGTGAEGRFGPDLTHLMSRATIASGAATNDLDHLVDWITSPDHIKPGALMPAMKLEEQHIRLVAEYLHSLR